MDEVKDQRPRRAAVSLVERGDRILCVWNKRYNGWSMPGGMVEDGETVEEAQRRELREETGLTTLAAVQFFEGEHGLRAQNNEREKRASVVHVFMATVDGEPLAVEEGCPLCWLTRDEFVRESPFGTFYKRVFAIESEMKLD